MNITEKDFEIIEAHNYSNGAHIDALFEKLGMGAYVEKNDGLWNIIEDEQLKYSANGVSGIDGWHEVCRKAAEMMERHIKWLEWRDEK